MKHLRFLICILCCIMVLTMVSCTVIVKHPIQEFKNNLEKSGSCQVKVSMEVPNLGTCTSEILIDGNVQHTLAMMCNGYTISEESYTEMVGDIVYTYEKNEYGKWVRTEDIDEPSSLFAAQLWDPNNYQKVQGSENTYKQKENVVFDTGILSNSLIEDVVISVGEDSCIIKMKMTVNGMVCDTKCHISKLGQVSVTLPKVS